MILFSETIQHLNSDRLPDVLKAELEQLHHDQLPLQAGLAHSSYVSPTPFKAVVLQQSLADDRLQVKAGIFYSGIIAGCNCADDPSPVDEINEYCELAISIDMHTGKADISLL